MIIIDIDITFLKQLYEDYLSLCFIYYLSIDYEGSLSEYNFNQLQASGADIRHLRQCVYIHELGIPADLEWDGRDQGCIHALAHTTDNKAITTAGLLYGGQLGRMAVLADWRSQGVGTLLLRTLISAASEQGFSLMVPPFGRRVSSTSIWPVNYDYARHMTNEH